MGEFLDLWRAHPGNQGAIRAWQPNRDSLGAAPLGTASASHITAAITQAWPRSGTAALAAQRGVPALALAEALRDHALEGFGPCQVLKAPGVRAFLAAAFATPGLIYVRRDGTHLIDLWNGYRSTTRGIAEWTGWLEQAAATGTPLEIWFWPVA